MSEDNDAFDTKGGKNTNDYVSLMSIREAETYFKESSERSASLTDGTGVWWWQLRIGMPRFVSVTGHIRSGAKRAADIAVVEQLAAGLDAAAHKRVGRDADEQPLFTAERKKLSRVLAVDRHRLLAVRVLSGFQRLNGDAVMLLRRRQVDDDLDLRIGEHVVHRLVNHRDIPVGGGLGAALGDQVADALDRDDRMKELRKVFQINRADIAVSDNADSDFFHRISSFPTHRHARRPKPPSEHLSAVFKHRRVKPALHGDVLALDRPEHAAAHDLLGRGRIVKDVVGMAERGVENAAVSPFFRPDDRHIDGLVGAVIISRLREARRRQNFNGRIDVQVILLAANVKILDSLDDRAGRVSADLHGVVDNPARMRHPVGAGHKLPFDVLAEGVAHSAVIAGQSRPGGDGSADVTAQLARQIAPRPDRHNQMQAHEPLGVGKGVERVRDTDLQALVFQNPLKARGDLVRLVSVPAAPYDQRLFFRHFDPSFPFCPAAAAQSAAAGEPGLSCRYKDT